VFLTIVVPVLAAVAGLMLVHRLVPSELREDHNDVAGFIYAVLGVSYAVLLGLVLVAVWQNYEASRTDLDSEANELAGIYHLAAQFPEPEHTRVQDLATAYARVVMEEEWPMMQRGGASPHAAALLNELRITLVKFDPHTPGEQVLYERELTLIHDMSDARRLRLLQAREGIPDLLWIVLGGGGVITVCFTYLFGLKSNWAHVLMVAALTLVICGILFTIAELDYPFAGAVKIQPEALREVLGSF
jgi:Protein of unknown function (DUF4239)